MAQAQGHALPKAVLTCPLLAPHVWLQPITSSCSLNPQMKRPTTIQHKVSAPSSPVFGVWHHHVACHVAHLEWYRFPVPVDGERKLRQGVSRCTTQPGGLWGRRLPPDLRNRGAFLHVGRCFSHVFHYKKIRKKEKEKQQVSRHSVVPSAVSSLSWLQPSALFVISTCSITASEAVQIQKVKIWLQPNSVRYNEQNGKKKNRVVEIRT